MSASWLLLLAPASLLAVTVSSTANCNGVAVGGPGFPSATCGGGGGSGGPGASASAGATFARAEAAAFSVFDSFRASARSSAEFLLTFHGSWPEAVGNTFWWPIIGASAGRTSSAAGGAVTGPGGTVGTGVSGFGSDTTAGRWTRRNPFTFEVPQLISMSFEASASAFASPTSISTPHGEASLQGFVILDSAGNVRSANYSLTPIPEPSAVPILAAAFLAAALRKR